MGHEFAEGRDEGVRVHDFHGVSAAYVPIDELISRKGQLPKTRLPAGGAIRVGGKNPALVKQSIPIAAIKATHASNGVGYIGGEGIICVITGSGGRAGVIGIEHQHSWGGNVGAIVPDMGDDDAPEGAGKIDSHTAGRIIGRNKSYRDGVGELLARGRIGRFTGRHGHDLLAHDHEAVVEDAHHHDQEDGQDEGEFDEGLALALLAEGSQLLKIGGMLHVTFCADAGMFRRNLIARGRRPRLMDNGYSKSANLRQLESL